MAGCVVMIPPDDKTNPSSKRIPTSTPPAHTTPQVYISIQYQVIREKVYDAVYKLTSPQEQVRNGQGPGQAGQGKAAAF